MPRVDASQKKIDAGDRDVARESGSAVQTQRLVGQSSAPAGLADCVCDRRLKQPNLIRMRKQLQRFFAGAVLIGGPRQWLDQRTVVAEHGQSSLIEESPASPACSDESRMSRRSPAKPEVNSPAESPDCAALRASSTDAVLVERNEHVVAVVSAVQENANQRFVVRRGLRRKRVNDAKALEARSHRHAAERARAGAKKVSACCCHVSLSLYVVLRRSCCQVNRHARPFLMTSGQVSVVDCIHRGDDRGAHLRGHRAVQQQRVERVCD